MVNNRVYVLPCGNEAVIVGISDDDKKYIVEYDDGKMAEVNKWQCKPIDVDG